MATIQQLLDDINLRYRNTFTNAQKIVWMNEEQQTLFEILQIDSAPYGFDTVLDQFLYAIDSEIDVDRIKELSIQVNDSATPDFRPLPFKRLTDDVNVSEYWYTIVERNFYVNVPGGAIGGRSVYIYLDSQPTLISASALTVEPSIPLRFQEILKLGTLERIAAARKDVIMKNNYNTDKETLILDVEWKMKMSEPTLMQPVDALPRRSRYRSNRVVQYVSLQEW